MLLHSHQDKGGEEKIDMKKKNIMTEQRHVNIENMNGFLNVT